MRISDWSSDVCSSDLVILAPAFIVGHPHDDRGEGAQRADHARQFGLILRHARRREGRLAIARASHRLIAERARGHVLPYQYAEPVGVVIILRGFDLDMLAEHVEAGLLDRKSTRLHSS